DAMSTGSWYPYAYALNSPANYTDPMGLCDSGNLNCFLSAYKQSTSQPLLHEIDRQNLVQAIEDSRKAGANFSLNQEFGQANARSVGNIQSAYHRHIGKYEDALVRGTGQAQRNATLISATVNK